MHARAVSSLVNVSAECTLTGVPPHLTHTFVRYFVALPALFACQRFVYASLGMTNKNDTRAHMDLGWGGVGGAWTPPQTHSLQLSRIHSYRVRRVTSLSVGAQEVCSTTACPGGMCSPCARASTVTCTHALAHAREHMHMHTCTWSTHTHAREHRC